MKKSSSIITLTAFLLLNFLFLESFCITIKSQDANNSKGEKLIMASFPGGEKELYKYFKENIRYPEEIRKKGIERKVKATFIVETDGSISNITIVEKVHPALDAEVVRLLKNMPRWIPGRKGDELVRVRYTAPVIFSIADFENNKRTEYVSLEDDNEVLVIIKENSGKDYVSLPESEIKSNNNRERDLLICYEEWPSAYPGGEFAFYDYIKNTLQDSLFVFQDDVRRTVVCDFIIDKKGFPQNIRILKGITTKIDAEVMRVLANMQRWIPGRLGGDSLSMYYILKIKFVPGGEIETEIVYELSEELEKLELDEQRYSEKYSKE